MAAYLLFAVYRFVRLSLRWPLVGDATLMHYCILLLRHGLAPYRQIVDINLPGTYFVEWLVIRLFGYGPLPWRLFDLLLLLVTGLAFLLVLWMAETAATAGIDVGMTAHAPQRAGASLFAALWATAIFALLHGRDGIAQLGQRDLLVTACLAVGVALLLTGFRLRRSSSRLEAAALAGSGVAVGAASTIKPLALLLLPALLALYTHFRRKAPVPAPSRSGEEDNRRSTRLPAPFLAPLPGALIGALLPLLAALAFLLYLHAASGFWLITTQLVPLHASLFRLGLPHLLAIAISSAMLPLCLLGLPVAISRRPWRCLAGSVILAGCGFGLLSFCVQGRGYAYHRYPLHFFLLLLLAWAVPGALRSRETPLPLRCCALLCVLFGALAIVPRSLSAIAQYTPEIDTFDAALSSTLLQEQAGVPGGPAGRVQCLDMAGGCVTTLLRLGLPQSTGFLYDCYAVLPVAPLFLREQQRYRSAWLGALAAHPPVLIIATSDECGPVDHTYQKLARWPELDLLLQSRYTLTTEWRPTVEQRWAGQPVLPYGFRIYSLRPGR